MNMLSVGAGRRCGQRKLVCRLEAEAPAGTSMLVHRV
jgi:hypothetical protein